MGDEDYTDAEPVSAAAAAPAAAVAAAAAAATAAAAGGKRQQPHQRQGPGQGKKQARGLARLLRPAAAPSGAAAAAAAGAAPAAPQELPGEAGNGHQPPHLMKTSQYRWGGKSAVHTALWIWPTLAACCAAGPALIAPRLATCQAATAPPASAAGPSLPPARQCRGVSWCKRRSLWEAAISINGKRER